MLSRSRMAVAVGLLTFAFIGFGPSVQPAAAYTWAWPTTGYISQPYGCTGFYAEPPYGSCLHFHRGIDIANSAWTKIRAASSGVVTYVGYNPYDPSCCRAWVVVIHHDNGLTGWYAHMQPVYVAGAHKGDRVWAGKLIGYMGKTGMATGVHLHFQLNNSSGAPVNPRNYITSRLNSIYSAQAASPSAPKNAPAAPAAGDSIVQDPADASTANGGGSQPVTLPETIQVLPRRYAIPV